MRGRMADVHKRQWCAASHLRGDDGQSRRPEAEKKKSLPGGRLLSVFLPLLRSLLRSQALA